MQSPQAKALIGLLSIGAIVALFLVLGGEDDSGEPVTTTTTAEQPTDGGAKQPKPEPAGPEKTVIDIEGGQPVGGVAEIEVDKGDEVVLVVNSDVADHVHVHGYDLFSDIAAGGTAKIGFTADIDGIFEVELEDSAVEIATLRVSP